MARRFFWPSAIVLMLVLTGCPLLNGGNQTFMSADTGGGSILDGFGPETAGEGDSEGGENGGETREVVEPDVIRRQGELLYVLNQYRGLSIVNLESQALLAQVPTLGYPRDLYFDGAQAYVLVGYAQDVTVEDGEVDVSAMSRLYVVDVANPAEAAIRSSVDISGDFVDSRLVGDVIYAVSAEYNYYGGVFEDIVYPGDIASTSVTSINVSNPDSVVVADVVSFGSAGAVIQVTPEFAFVAIPDWQNDTTEIACFDIRDPGGAIQAIGAVRVAGYVDDKFKMDAWEGALRVVSSAWRGERHVYLTTFDLMDPALPLLAEMTLDGAEGETLFATRFDGPRAYVVTFLVVDPLFVIDVADPAAPVLLGALEVPGYSTYIEPQGDRLIALGVDNTNGQQISVSIFDVSGNAAPSLVDRVSFGEEWAWSNAFQDVKALTILDDVIIVPFSGWSGYAGGYDRLQFVSYTADSLQLRGAVDLSGSILRSLEYGDYYYGVTTEQVTRIDASNLDQPSAVSSVTIAENLVDFIPLDGGAGVEIVARYDEGEIVVRTIDATDAVLGELVVTVGDFIAAYPADEAVVLVGAQRDADSGYSVAVVGLTDLAAPAVLHEITADVYPYYGYYYYYDYGFGRPEGTEPGVAEPGVAAKDVALWYPYYYGAGGESGFLLGDTLVLRCFADRFDTTLGGGTAYEGLAVIDIAEGTLNSTIGLGYDHLVSLDAAGGTLYASTKESVASLPFQRPMASFYVREINVNTATAGPAVNVPGAFVQYDTDTDVLVLRDYQWTSTGDVDSTIETVRWSGSGAVTPLDSISAPEYSITVLPAGDYLYVDSYAPTYQISRIQVGANGALTADTPLPITGAYGNLVGAKGDDVFVGLGYSALAHYSFAGGSGELIELAPVNGYPASVRFGPVSAYFPLGYYGLVELMLQ